MSYAISQRLRSVTLAGLAIALAWSAACGKGGGGSPTAPTPTPTTTAVTVGYPAGGTFFIGREVQFEARQTLSDGSTRVATNATWGSDTPGVATVSANGLVRGVAAGEATIFADAPVRGVLRIRVYPDFGGTWRGNEVINSCQGSGTLAALCAEFGPGEVGLHDSSFTQADASVNAVIDAGDGSTARTTGTISVGGELQLPSVPFLPAEPGIDSQVQNWRSRSDVPAAMTGTYDLYVTAAGVSGFIRLSLRLENVVRTSSQAGQAQPPDGRTFVNRLRQRTRTSRAGLNSR